MVCHETMLVSILLKEEPNCRPAIAQRQGNCTEPQQLYRAKVIPQGQGDHALQWESEAAVLTDKGGDYVAKSEKLNHALTLSKCKSCSPL